MTAAEPVYRLGEFHALKAAGRQFLYLVPAGAIFELDDAAAVLLDSVGGGATHAELRQRLEARGVAEAEDVIEELRAARAIVTGDEPNNTPAEPPQDFPLQTLVMNLTNQCNLACEYCYEFGEDKVATPEGKPKFMDWETARQSVDYLFRDSAGRNAVHITFFGGETLMNFPLLQQVVDYANEQARRRSVSIDFSLTTNATLLNTRVIEYLAENRVGVTVSMDGPKELHDQLRVFKNGRGSYDVIEPKVRELLARH